MSPELAFALALLGVIAALAVPSYREWRAKRNERQLEDEIRARRGWKTMQRMGWTPEDLQ